MSHGVNYDEDIYENSFFSTLQNQHKRIFDKATGNRWLICIPRVSSLKKADIPCSDIEDHILIPVNEGEGDFKTLSSKRVRLENNALVTSDDFGVSQCVSVLFEEIFYNSNDESYTVMCIDHPLTVTPDEVVTYATTQGDIRPPSTYEECMTLLWPDSGTSKRSQDGMDKLLTSFLNSYNRLQNENLRYVMDAANAQFTQAMKTSLKDPHLRDKARSNPYFMDNLKIAVETYMMHFLHKKLFSAITLFLASQDSLLNKTTRNLSKLQLKDLAVKQHFCENIPLARREISRLNRYSTPLGKLFCVRRVVRAISKPSSRHPSLNIMMTTDDFLPILMFLIVKSQIANWHANLVYMKHFNFAKTSNADEHGFYLASIEGALEHILSGQLKEVLSSSDTVKRKTQWMLHTPNLKPGDIDKSMDNFTVEHLSPIEALFQAIQEGNRDAIGGLVGQNRPSPSLPVQQLCHPLCSCDRCEMLQKRSRSDPATVTVYSRDDRGYTVLHAAAAAGHSILVDMLVQKGAVVNASDYMGSTPLHVSAERGLQDFMLMLLHYRADPNLRDNDGNTALHVAASNGHEDCVKALVFYDVYGLRADVDPCNDMGDTPLHLAAKWGYETIVTVLLENGAQIEVFNRKRETPFKVAANALIQRILTQFVLYEAPVFIDYSQLRSRTKLQAYETNVQTQPLTSVTPVQPDTVAHINHEKKVARLFQAVASDDLELVKFYLGWQEEWEEEAEGGQVRGEELCHPLCQCQNCAPLHTHTNSQSDGIPIDSFRSSDHMTSLHTAVTNRKPAMVAFLLKHHANINCQMKKQSTPLHLAAFSGFTNIVEMLVDAKAKVNTRDLHGNTALHFACMKSDITAVHCLLDAKANPNLVNSKGNTPLHEAVINNMADIVDLLLKNGSTIDTVDKSGSSALMLAQDAAMYKRLLDHASYTAPLSRDTPSNTHPEISIRALFAAFEEKDLATLRNLGDSIRTFDKERSLRHSSTKQSFYPIIDWKYDDESIDDQSELGSQGRYRSTSEENPDGSMESFGLSENSEGSVVVVKSGQTIGMEVVYLPGRKGAEEVGSLVKDCGTGDIIDVASDVMEEMEAQDNMSDVDDVATYTMSDTTSEMSDVKVSSMSDTTSKMSDVKDSSMSDTTSKMSDVKVSSMSDTTSKMSDVKVSSMSDTTSEMSDVKVSSMSDTTSKMSDVKVSSMSDTTSKMSDVKDSSMSDTTSKMSDVKVSSMSDTTSKMSDVKVSSMSDTTSKMSDVKDSSMSDTTSKMSDVKVSSMSDTTSKMSDVKDSSMSDTTSKMSDVKDSSMSDTTSKMSDVKVSSMSDTTSEMSDVKDSSMSDTTSKMCT